MTNNTTVTAIAITNSKQAPLPILAGIILLLGVSFPTNALAEDDLAGPARQDTRRWFVAHVVHPKEIAEAQDLHNRAAEFAEKEDYTAALVAEKQSLKILERILGPEQSQVANSLNNVGSLFLLQRKFDAAVPLLEKALHVAEKALGPSHPELATIVKNLAVLYDKKGLLGRSEPLRERATMLTSNAHAAKHAEGEVRQVDSVEIVAARRFGEKVLLLLVVRGDGTRYSFNRDSEIDLEHSNSESRVRADGVFQLHSSFFGARRSGVILVPLATTGFHVDREGSGVRGAIALSTEMLSKQSFAGMPGAEITREDDLMLPVLFTYEPTREAGPVKAVRFMGAEGAIPPAIVPCLSAKRASVCHLGDHTKR